MPKSFSKNKGHQKKKSPTHKREPLEPNLLYRGPIHLKGAIESHRPVKVNGVYYVAATTSGAGVIDIVFGNSPAVLSQWSTWNQLYHEYRVLGMELHYVPVKNIANWAYGTAISVVDRASSGALGGVNAAIQHESALTHQMFSDFKRTVRLNGPEESDFIDVASPVAKNYIKVYSFGNATIQTIGSFFLTFLVEFRVKS